MMKIVISNEMYKVLIEELDNLRGNILTLEKSSVFSDRAKKELGFSERVENLSTLIHEIKQNATEVQG